MSSIFKAYDIRGVYPSELDEKAMYQIGAAFANRFKARKVLIGFDMRKSSKPLFKAITKALMEQGVDLTNIGLTTTPMMYFATAKFGYDAGIMVTASHNPPKYNGAKFVAKGGVPIGGASGIYDIEKMIGQKFTPAKRKGKMTSLKTAKAAYMKKELSFANLRAIKSFKIAIDTGNGMGGIIAPILFKKTKQKVIPLYFKLDGTFPNHEANPLKDENIADLVKTIKSKKADLGVAFDGDCDRVFLVDERGEKIYADILGAALIPIILNKHPKALVLANVTCSKVIREEVERLGGTFHECPVGHSLIKAQMRKEGAEFAIEFSGHFFLKDNYFLESPFAIVLMVLEELSRSGKTLSEFVAPYKRYFSTGELNFEVHEKDAIIARIEREMTDGAKRVSKLDGLKIEYANWWFNVRPSNTEPLLRLNLEADTAALRDEMAAKLSRMISDG